MTPTVLRIDSSARLTDSITRDLNDRIIARFDGAKIITRDLANALPHVDNVWVAANSTPKGERSTDQSAKLALSDELIAEIRAADTLVIGVAMYNFSTPASLKAWIDQICRVGETFNYGETGPVGLLTGKRAIVTIASGGVPLGSDYDHTSGYVRFVLGFIGISDVTFVAADQMMTDPEATLKSAHAAIDALAA